MNSSKGWLSYSNIVATLALFVALGGGAWALSKDSVGSRAIKQDAVRSQEIDDGKIKSKDVKDETLGAGQIADGSLGAAEIADGAVTALEIAGNAIGSGEIAGDAVTSGKIAGNAVTSGKIANGAVGSSEIADGAVGKSKIADEAVGSAEVIDGSLSGGDIAGNSLTGTQVDESSLGLVPAATNASLFAGRELAFGRVDSADGAVDVIATLPALDAELQDDGDPDNDLEIVLANTGSAPKVALHCPAGGGTAAPGLTVSGSGTGTMVCFAWNNPDAPDRTLIFCAHDVGNQEILCEVLRAP